MDVIPVTSESAGLIIAAGTTPDGRRRALDEPAARPDEPAAWSDLPAGGTDEFEIRHMDLLEVEQVDDAH